MADNPRARPGDLITILEDAIIVSPDCAPALTGAAIHALEGQDDLVRQAIQSAIEIVPAKTEEILAAAKQSPGSSSEIAADVANQSVPPPNLFPVAGGPVQPAALGNDPTRSPFDVTVSTGAGFDSNPGTASSEVESAYLRAGLGAKIERVLRRGSLEVSGNYTMLDYFRRVPGFLENNQLGNVSARFERPFGSRWTFSEEAKLSRDINPDFDGGLTTSVREQAFHTIYNRVAAAFDISPLWQVSSGYTLNGIDYNGDSASRVEERLAHEIGLESGYKFAGAAVLTASYEAEFVDYHHSPLDFTRHQVLAGIRTPLGSQVSTSLAAGAQFRRGGSGGPKTSPAAELSIDWNSSDATQVHWVNRYGQFDQELALLGFEQREGYQTRFRVDHRMSDDVSIFATAGALATQFDGREGSLDETAITGGIGVTWKLVGELDVNAGYHFVQLDSPLEPRDYVRHQLDAGVTYFF